MTTALVNRVCPSCRSEYVAGYLRCGSCDRALVEPGALAAGAPASAREALAGVPHVALLSASLAACREVERALIGAGVLAYLDVSDGCAPGTCGCQYLVVIAREDRERAAAVLEERYRALLAREGVGSLADGVVDLEAAEVTCPACGHSGPLDAGGCCGDCGLTLGVPA